MRPSLQFLWGVLLISACFVGAIAQRPRAQRPANKTAEIPGAPITPIPGRTVSVQWSGQAGCSNNTDENPILCGPNGSIKQGLGQQYAMNFTGDSFGGWSSYVAATPEDAFSIQKLIQTDAGSFSGLIKQVAVIAEGRQLVLPSECPLSTCTTYGMNLIHAPALWNRLLAVPNVGGAAIARRGCVIDSGIRFDHADLAANILTGASRTIVTALNAPTNTITPAAGGDNQFAGPDPAGYFSGHATHIAGIMAGVWNAVVEDGIAGVNGQNARVASCRIFDDQGPFYFGDSLAQCLTHAANQNLFVINLSLGGHDVDTPTLIRDAIQAACNAGSIVVVAAGNGVETDSGFVGVNVAGMDATASPTGATVAPMWPANFAGVLNCVLTVASVDDTTTLARSSNYGNNVRIAAPGVNIESDYNLGTGGLADTSPTLFMSGTSMATPHVAGAALLLSNAFPAATNIDVINCLVSTATTAVTPSFTGQNINGGLMDVNAAYDCLAKTFGVSCRAILIINLPQTGSCAPATINNADLFTAAPGVAATVSPAGPYAPGTHTVVITPNNGAAPCQVQVIVRPCPPIVCQAVTVQLTNTAVGSCDRANVPVASLFSEGPPGAVVTASPSSPYFPGTTVVTVTVTTPAGLSACTTTVTVLPCKPECRDIITDTCANPRLCTTSIKPETFVKASSVGNTVTGIFLTPGNPFTLGTTNVRAVVSYPRINSAPSDPCKVTVNPCKPKCKDVTVNTSPGICTGVVAPDAFLDPLSIGECALPLTTNNVVQTPPSPYPLGATRVTAVVKYPNNIISPKTDACTVTVVDKELPKVVPINRCLVVDKRHKKDDSKCFTVPQLATITDNCPGVTSRFSMCTVSPVPKEFGSNSKLPPLCARPSADQVCPLLGYLKPKEPRAVTVTVSATDASANSATSNTIITLNADVGDKSNPSDCVKV